MLRVILITPIVIALMGGAATLPAASKEVVQIYHINPKRNARTPLDEMANCLRDRVCYEVTSAAAAHFGVPPNALRVAKAAAILARAKGEETRYQITPHQDTRSAVSTFGPNRWFPRMEIGPPSFHSQQNQLVSMFTHGHQGEVSSRGEVGTMDM